MSAYSHDELKLSTSKARCLKKIAYASEEEAQLHLDGLKITQPFNGNHVYLCDQSEPGKPHWHLSGSPAHFTKKKNRRRRYS